MEPENEEQGEFRDRRSGRELRSGWDRRGHQPAPSAVSLETYMDRIVEDLDRRLGALERHDERTRDRLSQALSREQYDQRHQELVRDVDRLHRLKADEVSQVALVTRVVTLEEARIAQQAITSHAQASRRWMLLAAGALGGFISAGVTVGIRLFS